jgi:hypothetical protein
MAKPDLLLNLCEKAFLLELERTDKLTAKAEKLLVAVGVVAGLQVLDLKILSIVALSAFIALAVSVAFALTSMQVRNYKGYPRKKALLTQLSPDKVSDEAVSLSVCNMYLEAREDNARMNDNRARTLAWAVILLVLAFALMTGGHLAEIL